MNLAHAHLILNHVPVVGAFLGILLLITSLRSESLDLKRTSHQQYESGTAPLQIVVGASLGLLVLVALAAVPVYFTGESAEEVVEKLPGVTEGLINRHQDSALASLVAVEVLGGIALLGLVIFRFKDGIPRWFVAALLVLSVVADGLMARTAHLGGQIRHTEIRADRGTPPPGVTRKTEREEESEKKG